MIFVIDAFVRLFEENSKLGVFLSLSIKVDRGSLVT